MATETLEHREVLRMALPAAVSWDPEARQAVVIASTDAPQADGVALVHTREAIHWPTRPLPVFVNHEAHPREFVGSVVALELGREKGAAALIATVQLADSEAGRMAEPMVASGAARWSIRARVHRLDPGPGGSDYDRATDWEPAELSLVGVGMDAAAVTRSAESIQPTNLLEDPMTATPTKPEATEPTVSRAALREAQNLERSIRASGLDDAAADEVRGIAEAQGVAAARDVILDRMVEREAAAPTRTHVRAERAAAGGASLERRLEACLKGTSARVVTRELEDWLVQQGSISRIDNLSAKAIVARAFSTSDFPIALQSVVTRAVLNAYQSAQSGLIAASARQLLPDFRPMIGVRFSQLAALSKKAEGGEYKATRFSEEAAYELICDEYGTLIPLTRKAVINDDLGMVNRLVQEAGRAAAETDRDLLASALGTIDWTAQNSVGSAMGIEALGAGVLLLRRQIDVEERPVSFEPDLVIAAPEHELELRQLLGDYQPAAAGDVQPFSNLRLEIDHRLSDGAFYMVDSRYQPLMIGSIGDPVITTQEDFSTGDLMIRVQHDAAAAVVDTRSICKVNITA